MMIHIVKQQQIFRSDAVLNLHLGKFGVHDNWHPESPTFPQRVILN